MIDAGYRAPYAAQAFDLAWLAGPRAPKRCTACRQPGHYAPTCHLNLRPPAPPRVTGSRADQAARWVHKHREIGVTLRDAGAMFDITYQAVSQAWHRIYPGAPTPRITALAARRARTVELVGAGCNAAEIAAELDMTAEEVRRVCHRAGVKPAAMVLKPWDAAIAAVAAGESIIDAAADHGVSPGQLIRRAAARGVRSTVQGRRTGSTARALARIDSGESVVAACLAERCAAPGVYRALKRRGQRRIDEDAATARAAARQ